MKCPSEETLKLYIEQGDQFTDSDWDLNSIANHLLNCTECTWKTIYFDEISTSNRELLTLQDYSFLESQWQKYSIHERLTAISELSNFALSNKRKSELEIRELQGGSNVSISLRISCNNQGDIIVERSDNQPIDLYSKDKTVIGKAASLLSNEDARISKTWNIPLGEKGSVEMKAVKLSQNHWKINLDTSKCKDSESYDKLRIHIRKDSGDELLQCPLSGMNEISLNTGKWYIEIGNKDVISLVEIDFYEQ